MKRTHSCGELREKDTGKTVVLCGWVHQRRDHGSLIFIDLRDREGITQVVFAGGEIVTSAQELKSEYLISVEGEVKNRPAKTENEKIATGKIELAAAKFKVINASLVPPFEISETGEVSEELRFSYRYLDLRKPHNLENLRLRHKTCMVIRDFLDKAGFIEVETPLLTSSTPEGARDYLVPSRPNQGKFYALPQSPQLFKQLLMIAGLEKYFQIARCFRDEDLRADRQPEFSQLDIEMSFIDENDVYSLVEKLIAEIFKAIIGIELKLPFPRYSHAEAIEKFGTDKPDIRKDKDGFAFLWVHDFPLFKYNAQENRWESEHHPFTSPREEDMPLLEGDLSLVRARSYDLVVNGVEIGSGSIRIHKREIQEKIFKIIGISEQEAGERFGFLLRAFDYGAPPHGGVAFGLDRLLAILLKRESIREVIAFPKTQKAICPLTGAPSHVSKKQLEEIGLVLKKGVER